MCESGAVADKRIDTGGIAFIVSAVEGFVQGTDVLSSETLDDENDNILFEHNALSMER